MNRDRGAAPHLNVSISGAVVPVWVVVFGVIAVLLCAIAVGINNSQLRTLVDIHERNRLEAVGLRKEIRVLQLHAQDTESAMIRAGVAKREDFAPWGTEITEDERSEMQDHH